jgi:transcriptional regulator with XRE-family HTH domain
VSKSRLSQTMKEMRGGETQQQVSLGLNISRESLSKYENGNTKLPKDISRTLMGRYDNPQFAFATRYEYTGTGTVWLDGPNADLHRSSVKEKTMEEIGELTSALNNISFSKPLKNLSAWELPELEALLEEAVEAETAISTLIAVVCKEAGISYTEVYQKHYQQLRSKGWLQ